MYTNVASELMTDLEDPDVKHHLGPRIAQLLEHLGACADSRRRSPQFDSVGCLPGADKPQLEHIPHGVDQFGCFLRRGVRWQHERLEHHSIVLFVIGGSIGDDEQLVRIEGRPHALAHLASQAQRCEEIDISHVEYHLPLLHGVVKLHFHRVGGTQLSE